MIHPTASPSTRSRREKILITILLLVGILLVVFFGFRATRSLLRIQLTGLEAGSTNVEAIRGWMTVPYIAIAYGVPEGYVFEQIGVPPAGNKNKNLRRLNIDYFEGEPGALLNSIQVVITRYQADHPVPSEVNYD